MSASPPAPPSSMTVGEPEPASRNRTRRPGVGDFTTVLTADLVPAAGDGRTPRSGAGEFPGKVEAHDVHPFAQVKPVRVHPLRSGIKLETDTVVLDRQVSQPVQHRTPMALGAGDLVGHEVIDIQQ